jgi:hypothetical protein
VNCHRKCWRALWLLNSLGLDMALHYSDFPELQFHAGVNDTDVIQPL